jgi:serine/threonine-protein kinase
MRFDYYEGSESSRSADLASLALPEITKNAPPPVTSVRMVPAGARYSSLVGLTIADRYYVEGVLGRGTTSIVYRARCVDDAMPVAVKVLAPLSVELVDDAVADRFRFEAHALAEVDHPNVVSVLDFGTTEDGLIFTVMELLEGETLRSLLASRARLEPGEAVAIACSVADALQAFHERGVLHRDVKPSNVFISRGEAGVPLVKLMDLGLARAFEVATQAEADALPSPSEPPSSALRPRRNMSTQEGLILGTGPYMSPEQIRGGELDPRSDVYALGVVTYRMLTGTLPFTGSDLPHLLSLHLWDPAEPMATRAPGAAVPEALDRAVLRALEKDPDARPPTARDFARELSEALAQKEPPELASADAPVVDEVDGVIASRRQAARRVVAIVLVVATLLVAYAIVLRAFLRTRRVAGPMPTAVLQEMPRARPVPAPSPSGATAVSSTFASAPAAWQVDVGTATLERPHRGSARRQRAPRSTAPPPSATTATDDLKVPMWRTHARSER